MEIITAGLVARSGRHDRLLAAARHGAGHCGRVLDGVRRQDHRLGDRAERLRRRLRRSRCPTSMGDGAVATVRCGVGRPRHAPCPGGGRVLRCSLPPTTSRSSPRCCARSSATSGSTLPDGLDDAAWIVNAYLIAFVAVMPIAGRDQRHRRPAAHVRRGLRAVHRRHDHHPDLVVARSVPGRPRADRDRRRCDGARRARGRR